MTQTHRQTTKAGERHLLTGQQAGPAEFLVAKRKLFDSFGA